MAEIRAENLSKAYGTVRALAQVSAHFREGEVHAVLGENGAGKSTLMGILAGFIRPDAGNVTLDGQPLPLGQPDLCRKAGIGMVHQHFMLVEDFTVEENLALARLERLAAPLSLEDRAAPGLRLAQELGWPLEPQAKVRDLPVGVRQRLEILKCLADDAPVLILDEPTAVLGPAEVEDLMRVLAQLREGGKTIILIAHKLSEVLAICDRVTVLRKGEFIATAPRAEVTSDQLAEWMVGEVPALATRTDSTPGEIVLRLDSVTAKGDRGEDALRNLSLTVRAGEIVGIAGVDGNGQVELAEVAAAIRPTLQSPGDRGKNGVVYIPQDRQSDGLALQMSIFENMLISGHRRPELTHRGFIKIRQARNWAEGLRQRFEVKSPSIDDLASGLSGGNQQKVVISRSLDQTPELVICVNPTRGLDLRAAAFVHQCLRDVCARGAGVLLISTDLDEIAALAHVRWFISRGSLSRDLAAMVGQ